MQVPFPLVGRADWDPELCLRGGATILITSYARNSFFELAGGSRVYVSRAILIKCEPTCSNSTALQVSNYNSGNNYVRFNRQLSETNYSIANRLRNAWQETKLQKLRSCLY